MSVDNELPPLTGHPELDRWRLRYRAQLAGELPAPVPRQRPPTSSEILLWSLLQQEAIGWERERVTGPYRLDFYCHITKLAVEVDGGSHHGREAWARDEKRDRWHVEQGIATVRFSARDVERDPEGVLREIRTRLQVRLGLDELARQPQLAEVPAAAAAATRLSARSRLIGRPERLAARARLGARLGLVLLLLVAAVLEVNDHSISRWYLEGAAWLLQYLFKGLLAGTGLPGSFDA